MTIYLPETVPNFRQAFDETCHRILHSEQDAVFYALFVQLIEILRKHPLLKDHILALEIESAKRKQEFSLAALEALEDSWMRLWKYHCHSFRLRKQLVRIQQIATAPKEISYSLLYNRVLNSMWEFRHFSPLCRLLNEATRLFRNAKSEMLHGPLRPTHFESLKEVVFVMKIVTPRKLSKKEKHWKLHTKIIKPCLKIGTLPFKWSAERLPSALFSPKVAETEQKLSIPGRNDYEKRLNMQIMSETCLTFCWERVRFLQDCYLANGTFPTVKQFKGRWSSIRVTAWKSAQERCENEALIGANMALRHSLSDKANSFIDVFLAYEHQIHRKDYEKYLCVLKNHVHALLFKIENMQQNVETDRLLALPGTQKRAFVIDLASKYWKAHPLAKRDDVYRDYCIKCPSSRTLSRYRWEQIIRERKLDPRSKEAKIRGPGKKTSQI